MKSKINPNSVSLAGEFAVLSQLSLRGYDANMTLGHTKGVDILMSNPKTNKMYRVEVKTTYKSWSKSPRESKLFGVFVSDWMMGKVHEDIVDPNLFYCFVNIERDTHNFKFYIVPSLVVARYVKDQHSLWLREKKKEGKRVKNTSMRTFRMGVRGGKYTVTTPTVEKYENNWSFKR